MEHTEKIKTSYGHAVRTPATPVTPSSMASTPDRPASKQNKKRPQRQQSQQAKSTPNTPQQQRRASICNVSAPLSRNAKTATTSSPQRSSQNMSQKSFQRPPAHKRSATDSRTFDQIQAEHHYLLSSLQQQEARIRTLVAALATVQSQLQQPLTTAEARRLRKNAGFIKSKISDAEQQERLALIGIGHVSAELQSRYRHLHLHQHLNLQQEHIAHFYGHHNRNEHLNHHGHYDQHSQVPDTPYLVARQGPDGSANEKHTGMSAIPTISPKSWQERRSGGEAEFMSPMSPLAPVFQPGASFFLGHIHTAASNGGIDHVMADAAAVGDAYKQESLGGTTFAGEPEAEADGDTNTVDKVDRQVNEAKAVDFTPRSVPEEEPSTKLDQQNKSGVGVAGMHYVFDAHERDSGACDGDSDGPDEFVPREARLRRGSDDGKHQRQHQKPLTSGREKRMSLPPVSFSWPEEE